MQTVNLFIRKTHKYVNGWASLDDSDYLATVKMTPPKLVEGGVEPWEREKYVQHLRIPAGADHKLFAEAVRDTLSGSRCRHEYDCCGCASRSVFTRMLNKRDMLVEKTVTYNL